MKKTNFFRRVLPLLTLLVLTVTSAWADDKITLNNGSLGLTSTTYNTNFSKAVDGVTFKSNNLAKNSAGVALKANGEFWNSDAIPGKIKSINFTKLSFSSSNSATFTLYGASTAKGNTTAIATITANGAQDVDFSSYDYDFFYIKNGSSRALYFECDVVFEYEFADPSPAITWKWTDVIATASSTTYSNMASSRHKLYFLAGSTSDKVQAVSSCTIDDVTYSHELVISNATSSSRNVFFSGISGTGKLTVITGASVTANKAIILSTAAAGAVDNTKDIATLTSTPAVKTAYTTADDVTLDASTTYYINLLGKTSIVAVIWTPSAAPSRTLSSIELSGTYPTDFNKGDAFSHEGMTVTAHYEEQEVEDEDVTAKATFTGYNMSQAGTQTVTVSYKEGSITKTVDYDITVTTVPVINATTPAAYEASATEGEISYTISDATQGVNLTAALQGECDWIHNVTVEETKITFEMDAYEGTSADRTATIRLSYTGAANKDITITQKKVIVDYVTLPFSVTEGTSSSELKQMTGVTTVDVASKDYNNSTHKIKFEANDYIVIKTNERIGQCSFSFMMAAGAGTETFALQGSSNGTEWHTVETLTATGANQNDVCNVTSSLDFNEDDRYIKLLFQKTSVNVGLGAFTIAKYVAPTFWKATYKYNDGETQDAVDNVEFDDAAAYVLKEAPTSSPENLAFAGWNDGNATYAAGAAYELTKNVTFTAVWSYNGPTTTYNKATSADIATGVQFVWYGEKATGAKYVAKSGMTGTYMQDVALSQYSSLENDVLTLTDETNVQVFTLKEVEGGWNLLSGTKALAVIGDKQLGWNSGDMSWELTGTDKAPTFTASNSSKNYTMFFNSTNDRFNAYQEKNSNVDAVIYRLNDGKSIYALTLNYNDGETANETHKVLDGADYTLSATAPVRANYVFNGWKVNETTYAAGANVTVTDNVTLTAQWLPATGTVSFVATDGEKKYATFSSDRAVEFDEDVTVYTVTVKGTSINLNEVSKQVPANTGVLLTCANDNANYDFIASAESLGDNNLRPASVSKETDGSYLFYKLAYGDWTYKTNLGFYWGAEDGAPFESREGSTYLAVPNSAEGNAPARFVFNETNTATGLDTLENSEDAVKFMENGQVRILRNGVLYNALGQVVK